MPDAKLTRYLTHEQAGFVKRAIRRTIANLHEASKREGVDERGLDAELAFVLAREAQARGLDLVTRAELAIDAELVDENARLRARIEELERAVAVLT